MNPRSLKKAIEVAEKATRVKPDLSDLRQHLDGMLYLLVSAHLQQGKGWYYCELAGKKIVFYI